MNKKEIKRTAVRRRGTTIAAAALSIAMVGPFVHAVTPASPFAAVANAEENQPPAEAPATGDEKAIYSPGKASQKGTISGSVKEIVEAKVGFGEVQASGNPLKGVKVYAQWYEGENTQHSSPVYYTKSDENGNFTINMAPYTDAQGVTRKFEADASVGETIPQRDNKREKIRVWTELPEDMTDKYRLVHQPAAGIFPGIGANTTPTTQGDGVWGGNKITGMTIQYAQKDKLPQHLPDNKWTKSQGEGLYGLYLGRAFWNLDVLQGGLNHNTVSAFGGKDISAAGLKVVGSYLSDEAVQAIHDHAAKTYAGKTLRGKGWTTADEQGLQKWINEQIEADPEGWIAETVTTTTAADGTFRLYWKGIYGQAWDRRGTVPADKFHTLAASRDEGTFINGNSGSKHVNTDWSYVQVLGKDGKELPSNVGILYPWSLGQWAGPGASGSSADFFGGDGIEFNALDDKYLRWNVALAPQALKFDVVDKNTTDNWATFGDKVQTDTAGLPIADNLNYYIEWVDKNGKTVKTCETAKPDSATKIPSCELEVPADAQTGDTFTARLKVTAGNPDPKNDLVLAMDAFAVARDYLEYDPVDAKRGEEATSEPKFDNPATEGVETKPEKAKFELGKLPEGVKEDQVKVDPATGVVTFTPNADQAGKEFKFPVVMRDEALQVPVLDENGDPVKDESGNPKTQGRIVARADAPFKVAAGDTTAATVEPSYEDKLVVPGKETKSEPVFVKEDEDGKPTEEKVDAPEGSKFKITDGFTAPEGYTVEIDESTGVVTVTADPKKLNKDTVEEFEVPVTVTYPDESTDEVKAKFELDTDGDGTPDSKDDDDDGDGVPDQEEIDKDTNPKDKNERPLTPIEPGEDTTAATVEPSYEDKLVVPGKETKSEPVFVKEDEDGKPTEEKVDAPEGSKFKITDGFTAPEGYTVEIDESTGVVTVTADPKKLNKDTVEEFEVPVTVTYPDESTDEVKAKFELDTDGDGTPDSKDDDDDGDGVPDQEEIDKDTNPKDKNERPLTPIEPGEDTTAATVEPSYEDKLVVPGKETKSEPVFVKEDEDGKPTEEKVDAPEGSKFKITDGFTAPEGYTVEIDESTGVVTVTADPKKLNKDTVEEFEVPVTVTYPDESTDEVKAKFELDTDGDGTPDSKDDDDDGDGVPDQEEIDKDTNPKDKNERPLTPIEPGEDTTAATVEPDYEDGSGKPGEDVKVPAPEFKDEDGNPTTAPDDTKFTPGENTPDGVTIDENTGEITVTIPEDAKPGTKIEVPVVVTYPDDSTDEVTVTVTVDEPDAPETPEAKDNEKFEPEYKEGFGQPGTKAPVDAPTFTNKDGDKVIVPEGTKFTTDKDGVEVAADGSLKVQIPEDAKPGDKITVPVTVTYPDGSTDNVDVTVTVTDPEAQPEWGDGEGEPGDKVTVPNEGGNVPDGSTVETDGPGKAEIDENGNLIVDIDKDAKPGDKIVVEVKDPEGNTIDESTVTVTEPSAPADNPDWKDDKGTPGDKVEIPNTGGDVPEGTTVETEGPGKAEIVENGNLVVDIDKDAKPGDKIVVVVKDKDGNEIDRVVVEVEKPDAPETKKPDWKDDSGKPGDKVEIPNIGGPVEDGTTVETDGPGKAEIDKDGNLIVDIDKDAKPGDKIVVVVKDKDGKEIDRVVVEVEKPSKPIIPGGPTWPIDPNKPGEDDPSETPEVIKPTIDPAKEGDKEITGTAKPGTDITVTVTDKDGKKTEKTVKVGDDGKWKVVVDKELKTGDKIVAKDKDGNEASRIVTGDSKPGTPDGSADWTGSSNLSERCINTGLGIGIPLLFLIPVGLASQMNIPGLSEFVAPINKQIQDLNTRLQQQAGLFNGPLADQVNGINAQLKRFGADYQQAAGAVALIAAGALAIGLLADACAPGAGEGSSK